MYNISLSTTVVKEQNQNTIICQAGEIELHAGDEVFELLAERSIQVGWDIPLRALPLGYSFSK
jgi:hypothetical protein